MTALADMPDVLTVEEAAAVLRIGRSAAYAAARRGELGIKVGRTLRVPRHQLEAMLSPNNNNEDAAGNGALAKGDVDSAVQRDPCEA